ncbi:MAG: dUTP diphosphatase [Desulfobacterales bacterium]|nr:dUTP diphosphatase [Desulfobacterales bacterium]
MKLSIEIRKVRPDEDADIPLPRYMTRNASGMDIYAAVRESVELSPGEIVLVPTGLAMAVPPGFEAQIRPRSGLAVKHGIGLINSPGTIDSDYRGEVGVALINLGRSPYTIRRGDRIAQMVIQKVFQAELKEVKALDKSSRDTGGFGHTGI